MDTSETYTKMCEKAEEIQHQKPPVSRSVNGTTCFGDDGNCWDLERGETVWLPRQDQLQEMVIENTHNRDKLGSLLSRFWVFCSCEVFVSMEQVWVAFVMKEKYNKVWDGEEWHSAQISTIS